MRESSGVPHRLNSLHRGERYTLHMGTFTPHMGTHRFISNNTPISWEFSPHTGAHTSTRPSHGHPYPTQGHTHRHTHLMGILTHTGAPTSIRPSHGHRHPIQGHTMFHLSLKEERHIHLMGTPNSWALSQADSLSLCPGECLTKL